MNKFLLVVAVVISLALITVGIVAYFQNVSEWCNWAGLGFIVAGFVGIAAVYAVSRR